MLRFVLVEPAVPENVGAAARALKTMGFAELWVVNSEAQHGKLARIVAHGSTEILDGIRTFASLQAVRAEVDLMVGTSAKPRHHREVLLAPDALHENLQDKLASGAQVALVFGREDSGLRGAEIALCDLLTSIPLAVTYPSLNLGQAVMLYAYTLSGLAGPPPRQQGDKHQYLALREKADALVNELGYAPDSKIVLWLREHLPLLNSRSIGFMHQLIDSVRARIDDNNPRP